MPLNLLQIFAVHSAYSATNNIHKSKLSATPQMLEFYQQNTDKSEVVRTRMWANAQRDGRPAEHR